MIGKFKKEDIKSISRLCSYCFGGQDYEDKSCPLFPYPLDFYLGIFHEEEGEERMLTSALIMLPFEIKFASTPFLCKGIQAVVSKPEFRNKGQIRKLFVEAFRIMHENKIPLSNLHPFKFSYYEKYGYALSEESVVNKFNPSELGKIRSIPSSKNIIIREVFVEENSIPNDILEVFKRVAHEKLDYCAYPDRPKGLWSSLLMDKKIFMFVAYDISEKNSKEKEAVGYIIWHFVKNRCCPRELGITEEEIKKNVMVIKEMNWINVEAKVELFRLIWSHRDQINICAMVLPKGEDITPYFTNTDDVKRIIQPRTMIRIVLLQEVVEKVKVKKDISVDLIVKVIDETCPWNEGCWRFQKGFGEENIQMEKMKDESLYNVEMDIKFLTLIISGVRRIDELINSIPFSYGVDMEKILELRCFEEKRFNFFNDEF